MFDKSVYVSRRKRLIEKMSSGMILILGNGEALRIIRITPISSDRIARFFIFSG